MRAEQERRRAKDLEFDYWRMLRGGSCTDGAVLRQLRHGQKHAPQTRDPSSPMDRTDGEVFNDSFSSMSDLSAVRVASFPEPSPLPLQHSNSAESPLSPLGQRARGSGDSGGRSHRTSPADKSTGQRKGKLKLREDTDRAADDLLKLDRQAERCVPVVSTCFCANDGAH